MRDLFIPFILFCKGIILLISGIMIIYNLITRDYLVISSLLKLSIAALFGTTLILFGLYLVIMFLLIAHKEWQYFQD